MCIKKNYATIRAQRIYWSPADPKLKKQLFHFDCVKVRKHVQLNLQMIATTFHCLLIPLIPLLKSQNF